MALNLVAPTPGRRGPQVQAAAAAPSARSPALVRPLRPPRSAGRRFPRAGSFRGRQTGVPGRSEVRRPGRSGAAIVPFKHPAKWITEWRVQKELPSQDIAQYSVWGPKDIPSDRLV
jgi:hypothetical protein